MTTCEHPKKSHRDAKEGGKWGTICDACGGVVGAPKLHPAGTSSPRVTRDQAIADYEQNGKGP